MCIYFLSNYTVFERLKFFSTTYIIDHIYELNCQFRFSVQINKTYAKTFCDKTCQVILDTSTNVIGVPHEHVISINTLIGAVEYKYNRYRVSKSELFNFLYIYI